jgi:hypothetical protein
MIVKGYKDIYKGVSEKLDVPYDIVELIGNFTWRKLGESLDDFKHRETYMLGLGVFKFRKKRSLQYIKKIKNVKELLLGLGKSLEIAEAAQQRMDEKSAKMMRLNNEWDEIIQAKKEFRIKRQQYDANRNIQEQSGNMGGSKESSI